MPEPRFLVYTDPRPIDFPLLETYSPPAHQEELIRHLLQQGFHPLVNGLKQPEPTEVRSMWGIVLLDHGELVRADQYQKGTILCIQWYCEPIGKADLDTILRYCAPFYGIGQHRSFISQEEERLIQKGCMTPIPETPCLRQPTFIGNRVQIVNDHVKVLE